MKHGIAINIILFSLLTLFPLAGYAADIEYGLPDSLSDLNFWNDSGKFIAETPIAPCPPIPSIIVVPESGLVDSLNIYRIEMTLPSVGIPKLGGVVFGFPEGFGLHQITDIEYSDNDPGEDLVIRRAFVYGNNIAIFFKWGLSPPGGTVITFRIHSIKNPTISGIYQIIGVLFNRWLRIEYGPTFSEQFEIFPNNPVSLSISPDMDITIEAGNAQLFAATARDRFGNVISGLDLIWALAPEYDDIGILSTGFLFATTVGTGVVTVSYDELSARSGLITVKPGVLAGFEMTEYPPTVIAGEKFPSPVTVLAYDTFGNEKTDYDGYVYFTSSDSRADFFYGTANKYHFTASDFGNHTFDDSLFSLGTTGQQNITVTDGEHTGSSGLIAVIGGPLVSFSVDFSERAMAGEPLTITITNAVDRLGNPANGLVNVTLVEGGPAPDGSAPILNDIAVKDGIGSAQEYMFDAGTTVLGIKGGSIYREISITVQPGALGRLALEVQPTQFVNHPMIGPAAIAAFDRYGNLKTNFNASITPVNLRVTAGEMIPSVFDGKNDFVNGILDLTAKSVKFSGPAGSVDLVSTSADINSLPATLIFNGIDFSLNAKYPDSIYVWQRVQASVTAFNRGNLTPMRPAELSVSFESCDPICKTIEGLGAIPPGTSVSAFPAITSGSLAPNTLDSIITGIESRYLFDNDTITVIRSVKFPVWIRGPIDIAYVPNSLSIDSIVSPSVIPSLGLQFKLNTDIRTDSSHVFIQLFLIPNSGREDNLAYGEATYFDLEDGIITAQFSRIEVPDYRGDALILEGHKYLRAQVDIYDNSGLYIRDTVDSFDSVYVVFAPTLAVMAAL